MKIFRTKFSYTKISRITVDYGCVYKYVKCALVVVEVLKCLNSKLSSDYATTFGDEY